MHGKPYIFILLLFSFFLTSGCRDEYSISVHSHSLQHASSKDQYLFFLTIVKYAFYLKIVDNLTHQDSSYGLRFHKELIPDVDVFHRVVSYHDGCSMSARQTRA